ncbi:DUF2177 domain-containing protein [Candidatus Peregrinibacteria bacterium HGW-Peregrinibacteria-1]|jgi:uncharacterized membrane protein|nr:MAG: DUF2177 domain-containing protein [Candidatus Peregrinibacteria bacterium HGW-Peregrinibacteria-1]
MPISKLIISYLLTATVFFAIDMVWLGLIAKKIYNKYLSGFLSPQVNWPPAIVFYLIFIAGIMVFAIHPAITKNSPLTAITLGAFLGVLTYATYDLTNMATLKNWPIQVVLIDIAWGAILTASVSLAGYYIIKMIT